MPFTTICTYHFEELPSASDTNGLSETRMNTEMKRQACCLRLTVPLKFFVR